MQAPPGFVGFLAFTPPGPLVIGLRRRCRVGNVGGRFGGIFGWHRGRRQSPSRSGLPDAGWEKPQRGRDIMSTNWPPSQSGLLDRSNTQPVSGSNTDNASLNQQFTAAIAPRFAPASRKIPSPRRRSDEDSSGCEHHTKPRPYAPNAPEGPKGSNPRQLNTSTNFCAEPQKRGKRIL